MRRKAFTLVEVLTVIVIISILAAILFPAIGWMRNRSTHTVCADNIHQLGEAEHLYANDHDGWAPPATTAANGFLIQFDADPAAVAASPAVLRNALAPYIKSQDVWFCPGDPQAHKDVLWLGMRHLMSSYWIYPVTDALTRHRWPPRMELMGNSSDAANGVPLVCDAVGIPDLDSDVEFKTGNREAYSNHPDRMVNIIRHDLSLERKPASIMMGTD